MIKKIFNRIYSDYLLGSRLEEYEQILRLGLKHAYEFHSIHSFYLEQEKGLDPNKKYFINRHDIDTDVKTAKKFFNIEKKLGIKSSFYFRLSTLDYSLMKDINKYGSEASYHFEELATYAKKNKLKTQGAIFMNMGEIQKEFIANFTSIQKKLSYPIYTVASHGDFANRYLKLANHILLDETTRFQIGGIFETYDEKLMKNIDFRISEFQMDHIPVSINPYQLKMVF